ncbi:MAG: hypothetical protein A3F90_06450 [Deltaproteobacteria bacterium RIFCSPLOWO2_12_FULL_60_19]|nr:MAG: hypothetical protein A3F90_06450 [Deltaproteobacteria bacterium RIFCSPLOWO2_12_FULL_60_19]
MDHTGEGGLLDSQLTTPSADEQIQFLANVQRLLKEGAFVATYKYALLMALTDLSVEKGDDTGSPLNLSLSEIAEKFVYYYWRQTIPYVPPTISTLPHDGMILQQNTRSQAEIVRLVERAREAHSDIQNLKGNAPNKWRRLVQMVAAKIDEQPLWKLQRVGDEYLEFLYPNARQSDSVVLKVGVAFCFRRFHSLIGDLVRGAWARYVRRFNHNILGTTTDLHEFLFGTERLPLGNYIPILWELQNGSCFYCGHLLKRESSNVDHFIPWAVYPFDLGHNFVLAHDRPCNSKKSDMLASAEHLNKWAERNSMFREELRRRFDAAHLVYDLKVSARVTYWAYRQTFSANGLTWRRGEELVHLPSNWSSSLDVLLQ